MWHGDWLFVEGCGEELKKKGKCSVCGFMPFETISPTLRNNYKSDLNFLSLG